MARKPGEPVQFTYGSAQRIADVVRSVELTPPRAAPLRFSARIETQPREVRAAVFTGAWSLGSTKVVQFSNAPTTTITVHNLTMHLPFTHTQDCIVGKDGASWYLIDALDEPIKKGTFTAPWNKDTTKTVSIANRGTVAAFNDYATVAGAGAKKCTIARDGSSWHLVAAECT